MPRSTKLPRCTDPYALAEAVAHLCEDAHPDKDGWRAHCPLHQGKTSSAFSISPGEDRVVLYCFGGCETPAIVHALGLTMADLFVRQASSSHGTRHIVKVYDYTDAQGALLHQTVRWEPKHFTQRRPDPARPGHYIQNLQTISPVLYHLPAVLQAVHAHETIYVVEGEKDADTLNGKGFVATCNPMGAKKWHPTYTEVLRGAHVVLLADYDAPGAGHVEHVAKALFGAVADLKIVTAFHTDVPGSDVTDWIEAGHTRAEFEAVIAATPFYDG